MTNISHKAEKQSLRDAYQGQIASFHKKTTKINPEEKSKRVEQRKEKTMILVLDWKGKKTWRRD